MKLFAMPKNYPLFMPEAPCQNLIPEKLHSFSSIFYTFANEEICAVMGNWERQQEAKTEAREKERLSREVLGKFFYDLAKLTFTAMALVGGISLIVDEPQLKQGVLMGIGICLTFLFSYIGYNILKR